MQLWNSVFFQTYWLLSHSCDIRVQTLVNFYFDDSMQPSLLQCFVPCCSERWGHWSSNAPGASYHHAGRSTRRRPQCRSISYRLENRLGSYASGWEQALQHLAWWCRHVQTFCVRWKHLMLNKPWYPVKRFLLRPHSFHVCFLSFTTKQNSERAPRALLGLRA